MSTEVPWNKLPNSFSGFFLTFNLALFFIFWLYNIDSNCKISSKILIISIIGIIIGVIMFYLVDPYYKDKQRKKTEYENFWRHPLAEHTIPQPEKPAEPKVNRKVLVAVLLVIYGLFLFYFFKSGVSFFDR